MFKIYQEITDWSDCDYQVCNHTYLVDPKNKVIAFAIEGGTEVVKLKTGFNFDKRYRKFKETTHPELLQAIPKDFKLEKTERRAPELVKSANLKHYQVLSKGKQYYVTYNIAGNFYNCNCTGFGYRRTCSHVKAVAEKQQQDS